MATTRLEWRYTEHERGVSKAAIMSAGVTLIDARVCYDVTYEAIPEWQKAGKFKLTAEQAKVRKARPNYGKPWFAEINGRGLGPDGLQEPGGQRVQFSTQADAEEAASRFVTDVICGLAAALLEED